MELKAENVKNIRSLAVCKELLRQAIELNDQLNEELLRQKYKRCLAMAKMCGVEYDRWLMKKANAIGLGKDGVEYYLKARRKVSHYMGWQQRWLKIAEKFKEAKNDQN